MGRAAPVALATALFALGAAGAAPAVVVRLDNVRGAAGTTVEVAARLDAGADTVVATQNDIEVRAPLAVATRPGGGPDCSVEPGIGKEATAFARVPCEAAECDRVRALVLSFSNLDAIPDGAVLYRCRIAVDATAVDDVYPLVVRNVGASDHAGFALPASGLDGSITLGGQAVATVQVADAAVAAGEAVDLGVRALSGVMQSLDLELRYGPDTPVLTSGAGAQPACSAAAAGVRAAFSFRPQGCDPDADCRAVAARLVADGIALPLDTTLFTCRVRPRPIAPPGRYAIDCGGAFAEDAGGHAVLVQCAGGGLDVLTDAPTATPTAGLLGTRTRTAASAATPTAPLLATRTRTSAAAGGTDDDACAVVAPADGGIPPGLAWPVAAWWLARLRAGWARRRGRRA